MRTGTKSAEIMRLYEQGLSTREIADLVGCRPEYVRVVARQRKGSGRSDIDRRYLSSDRGQSHEKRRKARIMEAYYALPVDARASLRRRVYSQARREGKSISEASILAFNEILRHGREAAHA